MDGLRRLLIRFLPCRSGDRLVVVPFVGMLACLHVAVVLIYLAAVWESLEFRTPNPIDISLKLCFGFVMPLVLLLKWRWTRRSRGMVPAFDWFGAGLAAISMAMVAGLPDNLVRTNILDPFGQFLLSLTWAIWGAVAVVLLLTGMYCLSNELFSERQERQRLEALMDFTRRMSSLDHQALMDEAVMHMYQLLRADACVLFLWDPENQVLVPVAGHHDPAVYPQAYSQRMMNFKCPLGYGLTGWVMQTGEPYISGNVMADARSQAVPGWAKEQKSSLLAPVQIDGRILGVVRLTRQGLNQFSPDDLDLVLSFAGQAAMVIEHGRIVKELSNLTIMDSLTGLFNVRHFHHVLAVETARLERYGGSLALLMIDSDSLKERNDQLGHSQGDEFIRRISRVVRENTRFVDHAFRYAGDQFLVLLPNTGLEGAAFVAERIRVLVQEREAALGFTGMVSAGVAVMPQHATDGEGLLRAAEQALYAAKAAGKNRAVVATSVGSTRE